MFLTFAAGLMPVGGCEPESHVYDPAAISAAKRVAVLPGVGAPGSDGAGAGQMEAGVLVTSLSNLTRFEVEGPGRLRKAMAAQGGDVWSGGLQANLARELGIDMLVVNEVTDYRFTKEWKSSWWFLGSSAWTETTYWVGVNVRFIKPDDGKLVYSGTGAGKSAKGYGPAVAEATEASLKELKEFLAQQQTK